MSILRSIANRVMRALKGLSPGSHVVWLDQVIPMYRSAAFVQEAVIGVQRSTNHRFRCVVVFQRTNRDARRTIQRGAI
jgi:hypothetical protein